MSRRDEAGTTLIEVIVAVAIMGIAFVVILGGIGTAIIGAGSQKQQASAGLVLRTAAEALTYQPCATKTTYVPAQPDGFAVAVVQVSFWNSATKLYEPMVPQSCSSPVPPAPPTDSGLQLIDLMVTATSGRGAAPQMLQVVKRQP